MLYSLIEHQKDKPPYFKTKAMEKNKNQKIGEIDEAIQAIDKSIELVSKLPFERISQKERLYDVRNELKLETIQIQDEYNAND